MLIKDHENRKEIKFLQEEIQTYKRLFGSKTFEKFQQISLKYNEAMKKYEMLKIKYLNERKCQKVKIP